MESKFVVFSFQRRAFVLLKIGREMLLMLFIATIVASAMYVLLKDILSEFHFKAIIVLISCFIPVGIAFKKKTLIKHCKQRGYRLILATGIAIIFFWAFMAFGWKNCILFASIAIAAFIISAAIGLNSKKELSPLKAMMATSMIIAFACVGEFFFCITNTIGTAPIISGAMSLAFCFMNAAEFYELGQFMKMSAEKSEIEQQINNRAASFFVSLSGMFFFPDACRLLTRIIDRRYEDETKKIN